MQFDVPEEVRRAIANADSVIATERTAKQRAKENERLRLEAVEKLRQVRAGELAGYADDVFVWLAAFLQSDEGERIRQLVGARVCLSLFTARFWKGEPSPPGDVTTSATLTLEMTRLPRSEWIVLRYFERYKGNIASKITIASQSGLVAELHPEFLKQLHDHLRGPDAWKFILNDLGRRFPAR